MANCQFMIFVECVDLLSVYFLQKKKKNWPGVLWRASFCATDLLVPVEASKNVT